jgi:hypothetical protein
MNLDLIGFKGNRFADVVFRFPCRQKVLMVTDGLLGFGGNDFGLSEFVGIVQGAGHTVTTAHRTGDPNATISDPFVFDGAIANYDQLWLFGFDNINTNPLSAAEQKKIESFMQSGGGVFATGDHATIGAGMGANIPRVRYMRNWAGIPMADQNRHDTVLDPGADSIKQFDDQADAIAQRVFPFFFSNGGPSTMPSSWSVHPVLRHPSGAVDVLPDHPHESECLAPQPDGGNFDEFVEWPAPLGGGPRIAAQVVAVSISAGRFITDIIKPPVNPHSFGAISAYDGDGANVGRVVCDATWHHFVNINLNGAGAAPDGNGNPRNGLYVGGAPTPEYLKIQRYYLNTVRWLAPKSRRFCWPFLQAVLTRFDAEVAELQLPRPHPCPWDPLQHIGIVVEEAFARRWGPGTAADVLDELFGVANFGPTLSRLMKAQQDARGDKGDKHADPSLLPVQDLRRALLGSVVNVLAQNLPTDEAKLEALLRDGHDDLARKLIPEGLRGAEPAMSDYLDRVMKSSRTLAKAIQEENKNTAGAGADANANAGAKR